MNNIIEAFIDIVLSKRGQGYILVCIFSIMAFICLIGAFFNPFMLVLVGMCLILVLCGLSEIKKSKENE